jgi:hypothetical protein
MKRHEFRNWVHNLWLDNCEERTIYSDGDRLSEQEYFQRFKWWLKDLYKKEQLKELNRKAREEKFSQWNKTNI